MAAAVRSMIIATAASNRDKARGAIKLYSLVPVADLKVQPVPATRQRAGDEIVEQCLPNPAPLLGGIDCQQQQLGFIGDRSYQRKSDRLPVLFSQGEGNAMHWQDPGALRTGPGLAKARLEGGGHDPHHLVEVVDASRSEPDH